MIFKGFEFFISSARVSTCYAHLLSFCPSSGVVLPAPAMFDWQVELAPPPFKPGITETPVHPPMMHTADPTAQLTTSAPKPSFV